LVPTIRDFANLPAVDSDGISLKPLLTGASNPPRREFVISQYYGKQQWVNPIRTIRTAQNKYNKYLGDGEELYDLDKDPGEVVNLADDPKYGPIKQRLASQLDRWIAEHHDPFYSLKTTPHQKGRGE